MIASQPQYAHSVPARPQNEWELLADHLMRVGDHAGQLAGSFGWSGAASLAGQLHDIGKASEQFQAYIRQADGAMGAARVSGGDHSTAGAYLASRHYGSLGRLLGFGIAGHHAGLGNAAELDRRLEHFGSAAAIGRWTEAVAPLPALSDLKPDRSFVPNRRYGFGQALLARMLFSCLVDADFIETERFYGAISRGDFLPIERLLQNLRDFEVTRRVETSAMNTLRTDVRAHAVAKAELSPGLFTLTVPTGGGKTLTSLAFALEHAVRHGMRRIVYVIPYTSIIEQTADVFRIALGAPEAVLEHHASFDWEAAGRGAAVEDLQGEDGLARLRRAAENWDAPIIVTTAVQFFESLFAARGSRCRKLHNLARSVIVLDEAQTLPLHLLHPCLAALDELQLNYGISVVLCTATQPAIRTVQDKFMGGLDIPDDRELAPDPPRLYARLRRVNVECHDGLVTDADLAAHISACPQILCIVNSRAHAAALFNAIRVLDGATHLSTLMCPRHRRTVLAELKRRLQAGLPVRLISTSLIEAGVDISFPEVWRALAGLDSIAQAAGRCNREGTLSGLGRVVVFEPAEHAPPHELKQLAGHARDVLRRHSDPLTLEAVRAYFGDVYWSRSARLDDAKLDGKPFSILREIAESAPGLNFNFADIARAFRMIDDAMDPIIVPWRRDVADKDAKMLLERIAASDRPGRGDLRRLQQYTVPAPPKLRETWLALGVLKPVHQSLGAALLALPDCAHYDDSTGLRIGDWAYRSADSNLMG